MNEREIKLARGWKVGEETYDTVVLRTPTALDLMESSYDLERPVTTSGGETQIAASPTLTAHNLLCRCITKIGAMNDPAPTRDYFKGLDPSDYETLIEASQDLAYGDAVMEAARKRGRVDPPSADGRGGGGDDFGGDGVDEGRS